MYRLVKRLSILSFSGSFEARKAPESRFHFLLMHPQVAAATGTAPNLKPQQNEAGDADEEWSFLTTVADTAKTTQVYENAQRKTEYKRYITNGEGGKGKMYGPLEWWKVSLGTICAWDICSNTLH